MRYLSMIKFGEKRLMPKHMLKTYISLRLEVCAEQLHMLIGTECERD